MEMLVKYYMGLKTETRGSHGITCTSGTSGREKMRLPWLLVETVHIHTEFLPVILLYSIKPGVYIQYQMYNYPPQIKNVLPNNNFEQQISTRFLEKHLLNKFERTFLPINSTEIKLHEIYQIQRSKLNEIKLY